MNDHNRNYHSDNKNYCYHQVMIKNAMCCDTSKYLVK